MSNEEIISCGIPQGTRISLFNIQMSNIFSIPLMNEITCYADDTFLKCYGENWDKIIYSIISDFNLIKLRLADIS